MKTLSAILLSGVVLALAGCGNQGGSSDPYKTESGAASKTNYDRRSVTNAYQGSARSPGRTNTGAGYSTNYSSPGTNVQVLTIDPARTNNVPEN